MNQKMRPWVISDLDNLLKYADNWNVAKNMTDKFPHPFGRSHGESFIAYANLEDPVRIFAIEVDGEAIGGVGIHPQTEVFCENAELGYWLAEPYWGKGIGSIALRKIVDFGFSNYDMSRIFARPYGTNVASQRLLEKNNFRLEGRFEKVVYKNGTYLDELVYAVRREFWENNMDSYPRQV